MAKFRIVYDVRNKGAIGRPFPLKGVISAESPVEALSKFREEHESLVDFVTPCACVEIPDQILSVIEYQSFFAVQHNPSGQQRAMGDGVDTLFSEDGTALLPGTPGFIEAWEKVLNAEVEGTLQAYWGDEHP